MNGLPYYKAYPRDFIEGTIGMSFELKGAYRLVLDLIYMQGGALPDDPRYISGLLGCTVRKWKSLRDQLVTLGKIDVSGEFLTNKRAVSELETLAKLQEKQAENASGSRKNNGLQKPRLNHTEPEPDIPPEKPTVSPPPQRSKATRLPDDWKPSSEEVAFAEQEGLSTDEISREAGRFRDYWHGVGGQKGTKRDWVATWRNWIRRAADDRRSASQRQRNHGRKANSVVAAAHRSLSADGREHGGAGNAVETVWGARSRDPDARLVGGAGRVGRTSDAGGHGEGVDGSAGGDESARHGRGGPDVFQRTDGAGTGGFSGRRDHERDTGDGQTIDVHAEPVGNHRSVPQADGRSHAVAQDHRAGADGGCVIDLTPLRSAAG